MTVTRSSTFVTRWSTVGTADLVVVEESAEVTAVDAVDAVDAVVEAEPAIAEPSPEDGVWTTWTPRSPATSINDTAIPAEAPETMPRPRPTPIF